VVIQVTKTGTGAGTVTSAPAGINCGVTCSAAFPYNKPVTLTATPTSARTVFTGWSGACTGTGQCVVPMTASVAVTATFSVIIPTRWDASWSIPGITYSNADLSISGNAATHKHARTIDGKSSGKWYWELTATGGDGTSDLGGIGIMDASFPNNAGYLGSANNSIGYGYGSCCSGQYYYAWTNATVNGTPGTTTASAAIKAGITYMFALDMDNGRFYTGQDGTWYNGGAPAAGLNPVATGITGTVYPGVTFYDSSTNSFTANFGGSAFKFAVPAGFNPGVYNLPTVWDPAWSPPGVTFTNNNLSISGNSAGVKNTRTLVGEKSGKYYWEIAATGGNATNNGGIGLLESVGPNNSYIGWQPSGISFGYADGHYYYNWAGAVLGAGTDGPANAAVKAGITYMFALDMTSGNFWAGQDGTWYNAGNPATGASPVLQKMTGQAFPGVTMYGSSINSFTANFGSQAFSYGPPPGFGAGFY
jgi:hypothetical protein